LNCPTWSAARIRHCPTALIGWSFQINQSHEGCQYSPSIQEVRFRRPSEFRLLTSFQLKREESSVKKNRKCFHWIDPTMSLQIGWENNNLLCVRWYNLFTAVINLVYVVHERPMSDSNLLLSFGIFHCGTPLESITTKQSPITWICLGKGELILTMFYMMNDLCPCCR
jgi:hypothetical protein